jgi:hypothetical protein
MFTLPRAGPLAMSLALTAGPVVQPEPAAGGPTPVVIRFAHGTTVNRQPYDFTRIVVRYAG